MTIAYRKRDNLFTSGETEWRVEDDALVRRASDGSERRIAWKDVTRARVRFYPTIAKPWLHQFRVEGCNASVTVDNGHFAGLADFEDRSESYSPFVRAALAHIGAQAPGAQIDVGSRPLTFWATMVFVAVSLGLLAAVLILLPLPAAPPFAAIVKLAVLAYGALMLPRWIRHNWPRRGDIAAAERELPGYSGASSS
jgi:hypothetical protein